MTLREAIVNLNALDEDSTIYAAEPWTEASEAEVSPESNGQGILSSSGMHQLKYFLEVFIAQDVIGHWKANLKEPSKIDEVCKRVIDYATYDA